MLEVLLFPTYKERFYASAARPEVSRGNMMKLRVGLVGLGNAWEMRHRPALRALSDRFEVRAICEPVAHRAEIAARDFGAASIDGFRALSEREDLDAILVLSGQWFGPLP